MVRATSVLAPVIWGISLLPAQGVVQPSLLTAPPGAAAPAGPAAVVAKVRSAVVHVFVEVEGPRGKFDIERASSGVIVDRGGLVLTWKHLVVEAVGATDKQLFVQLDDATNTRLLAAIVRLDEATGLALLRVQPPADGLGALELGPDRPRAGEQVVVLARPEGKDMLAFAGVASPSLAAVAHRGAALATSDVFLCDTRNDERCDGAPVVDAEGRLLGLYGSERVQRDTSEPTLEDLRRPSFGIVVAAGVVRRAFAAEFAGASSATLRTAPVAAPSASAAAVARVTPAVVGVFAGEGDWPAISGDDPGAVQRRSGVGSGVVLAASGLVVTNAHIVAGGQPRIRTQDGRVLPAKVQKRHGSTNLALLQVELPAGAALTAAPCAADDDTILGETVLAVGAPGPGDVVVSGGVVSARRGREGGRIQADANLGNPNAGGAVVDLTGALVGVGDGGAVDPLEVAFATRGDRITTETNLSTFVGIGAVRRAFAAELAGAAAPVATDRGARTGPLTAMVEKASGAMLNIYIARNVAVKDEDDPFAEMTEPKLVGLGLGSGVIVDRSGLALSNWHVVDAATNPDGSMRNDHVVTASVFGGKTYKVRVLSISREDDLSLLQLELEPGEEVQAVELGNSDALAIGEPVAAIGNPHGRANTITFGVVSAKDQSIRVKGRWAKLDHLIETDAAINGGNSGGALLDMQGRLVGINSAGGGTFNNKGYAIAVDHVRRQLLGLLLQPYKLRSPDLGMRVLDEDGKVVVMDVDERGPAAKAGVRAGDRIVELAGTAITWSPGFARVLLQQEAGVEVDLKVERKGEPKSFRLAPVPAAVWAVVRMANLQCRTFGYAEAPDRLRNAAIALHRRITGDPQAEPNVIPQSAVLVERTFPAPGQPPIPVEAGDLVLAVELRNEAGNPAFVAVDRLEQLRDLWNDRELGSYDGQAWRCWIARGETLQAVEITAKRLFW